MDKLKPNLVLSGEVEETESRQCSGCGRYISRGCVKGGSCSYFADMMTQDFDGIKIGDAQLKDCNFLLFDVTTMMFRDEFTPYISHVVMSLPEGIKQDEP